MLLSFVMNTRLLDTSFHQLRYEDFCAKRTDSWIVERRTDLLVLHLVKLLQRHKPEGMQWLKHVEAAIRVNALKA